MLQTLASCFIFLNVLMLFQPHCWVSRILEIDTDLKIWALGDTGLIFQQLGGLIFQFNTEPFICRVLPPQDLLTMTIKIIAQVQNFSPRTAFELRVEESVYHRDQTVVSWT